MTEDISAGDLLATYLRSRNIKVFEGITPLFDKTSGEQYDFSPVVTTFNVSPTMGQVTPIKNLDTIKGLGYTIISLPVRKPWFSRQQVEYRLVPYRPGLPNEAKDMPNAEGGTRRIHAELDSAGRLRLVGKNAGPTGYGPWVQTSKVLKTVTRPKDVKEYLSRPDSSSLAIKMRTRDTDISEDIQPAMDEIPVLITSDNELVCIKLEKDVVHIGVLGTTGTGKTMMSHALIDRIFWRTDNKIAILNDSVNQCYAWRKPMTTASFCDTLGRFQESPRGLPVAIFIPNSKNVLEVPFEHELAFRETINWEWIVTNWKLFLEKTPWELGLSEKYFRRYKNDFIKMDKIEQLLRFFQDKAETHEIQDKSADKICATLIDMWERKFIDRSTGIPSKWHYQLPNEHYEDDPYVGALRAGLIPVLNTVDLKDQHYHPQYTKYKIDQVRKYQLSIPTNKRKKLFLFFDEMGDIYKKGNDLTPAGRKMVETITQGRNFQIGAIYTLQNYSQLHPEIRNNTGYFFCFTMSAAEEGRALAKNLGLSKQLGESIVKLPKGQCIAASNAREWVIYTPNGERYRATGAVEGTPLPPLSMHYRPGDDL